LQSVPIKRINFPPLWCIARQKALTALRRSQLLDWQRMWTSRLEFSALVREFMPFRRFIDMAYAARGSLIGGLYCEGLADQGRGGRWRAIPTLQHLCR
jgi:hypothetical protein